MENANSSPGESKTDDNDNLSVASDGALSEKAASVKSNASGIPKPSGIRPPTGGISGGVSRIGRPCSGQQKPALPQMTTPVKNGSDDINVRRLPDDFGRHKLTDVQEENEDGSAANTTTTRRRYSSIGSTASSMDYLWDLHPRRLSEAGLSRHSDNSTILTEDTDSFIIGQRVWVGGTKPGSIAYIGETQFAPGDWAGIVLDQPIGKNDGSVGGIRYFQCEPKKGVFSRLTRLTRYSLVDSDTSVTDHITSTPINGTGRNSASPSGSLSPLKSPPSLTTSNTSLASTFVDFKLGDRVIIKSSQGSKIGTLRFMGSTEFAAGEWCGVELDEPRGKNDGSVGGRRYFDCRPNFGLFAPVGKVSRSPSNRKPGSCVVHPGAGLPPSGFRRANSRESLTSNTSITSAASGVRRVRLGVTSLTTPQRANPKTPTAALPTRTALQEVLKEKQQHIEQLLKERELERAEIAKAATQTEEAEHKYLLLKQEYDHYRLDAEKNLQDHVILLAQLKNEIKDIVSHLEDEKRKNEDLQFRFEEAAITKADLEVTNDTNLARISELESQLSQERQKVEALEGESNKLFEAEESLVRVKEENEILKYEIEVAAKKIQSLESEDSSNKDLVSSRAKEVEDLQEVLKQKDEVIEKIKTYAQSISDQYEQSRISFTKEIEEYKSKISTSNIECAESKTTIESLKTALDQARSELTEKVGLLSKTIESSKQLEGKLNKEIEKLKMDFSSKNLDSENMEEAIKKKDEEIQGLTSQLSSLKANIENQSGDITKIQDTAREMEDALRKELEDSRSMIKTKINEIEDVKKELVTVTALKEAELKESQKTIHDYVEEVKRLNQTITEIKEAGSKSFEELQKGNEEKIKDLEQKNADLNDVLREKDEILAKTSLELTKLQGDFESRNLDILNTQNELERAKIKLAEESSLLTKANEDLNHLRLNSNDLERKLKSSEEKSDELLQKKSRLEEEIKNLVGSSGDYSNKLDELCRELQEKDTNISNITLKLQDMEKIKEQIEMSHESYMKKSEKDLKEHEVTINDLTSAKNEIKEKLEGVILDNRTTIDSLNAKINEIQTSLNERDELLKKLDGESNLDREKSKIYLEKITEEYKSKLEGIQKKIDDLSKERGEIDEKLSRKSLEIVEMESKYNTEVELLKQTQHELKMSHEEKVKQLEHQLSEKDEEKSSLNESRKLEFDQKIKEMENQNDSIKKDLEEKIKDLTGKIEEYESKLDSVALEKSKVAENLEESKLQSDTVVKEMSSKISNLEEVLRNKEMSLQKLHEESTENQNKLKMEFAKSADFKSNLAQYQNEIEALNKEKVDVQKVLADKESEIEKAKVEREQLMQKSKEENDKLKNDFEEDRKKLSEQLDRLSEDVKNKEIEMENIKQLNKNGESIRDDKNKEIEQLKAELQINHSFIERLQAEKKNLIQHKENLTNSELEKEKQCEELNKKLVELSGELQNTNQVSQQLQTATNLYVTMLQLLQLDEDQKIALVDKLDDQIKKECDTESYTRLCKMVDGIKLIDDPKVGKIKTLEEELERYKKKQVELETRLKKQVTQIPQPKAKAQDNRKIDNGTKLDNVDTMPIILNNNNSPSITTNEQLMEEKLLAESQVAFLNSIIVDMQKKNEDQKARIEILESGYSPAAAEELGLLRLSERNLPPRMYCDICEEFDLHETEDCPQQANEDLPAATAKDRSPKEKPQQRPYCELCEMFGHATEDCQEDQTF